MIKKRRINNNKNPAQHSAKRGFSKIGYNKPMEKVPPGIYQHYKGNHYKVLGVGHHSETLEELVIYEALYTSQDFGKNALWVRPVKMFVEEVEVNGKKVPRFTYMRQ